MVVYFRLVSVCVAGSVLCVYVAEWCRDPGACSLYLDADASVDTRHVNAMRLSVGQVTLVHIYSKWLFQTSQVIPHLH